MKIRTILMLISFLITLITFILVNFFDIDVFNSKKITEQKIENLQGKIIDQEFREDYYGNDNKLLFISFISFLFFIGMIGYYYGGAGEFPSPPSPPGQQPSIADTQTICNKIEYLSEAILKLGTMIRISIDRNKSNDELNERRLLKASETLTSNLFQNTVINRKSVEVGGDRMEQYLQKKFLVIDQHFAQNNINLNEILEKLLLILKKIAEFEDGEGCFDISDDINDTNTNTEVEEKASTSTQTSDNDKNNK